MDGMEAATHITALKTGTPLVAMTANVMLSELEKYKKHGMPDCLGKPFTSRELWHTLLKYLKPVGIDVVNERTGSDKLQKMLRYNFIKNNQNIYNEISAAVSAGDTKLAHRLAHSLKGNAGMIGKTDLERAAREVEKLLKEDAALILERALTVLNTELIPVLNELQPLLEEHLKLQEAIEPLSHKEILALFDKLEPLLTSSNTECMALLNNVRAVPGGEALAARIEDFDFEAAAKALSDLRKNIK
jgi:HPt (histidine-containing phosphotransfer) domain-containing protein